MFSGLVLAATAALFAAGVYFFLRSFRAASGTVWQRLLAASKESATILWGYVVGAAGVLLSWSVTAADFFNLPEVRAFIDQNVKPQYVGVALTFIALVTIAARLRTLISSKPSE